MKVNRLMLVELVLLFICALALLSLFAARASATEQKEKQVARTAASLAVVSNTILIERDLMIEALKNEKDFDGLDLVIINGPERADLRLEVAYVPWTFDYTYKVLDQNTGIVVGAGKITAFNGYLAAPQLARKAVAKLKKHRAEAPVPKK